MRKWKRHAAAAIAVTAAVCAGILPAAAAEVQDPAAAPEKEDTFQILPSAQAIQTYDSGDYQIQVFGEFTRMIDGNGVASALEGSRLLYKRGTMLSVSSDFDFYQGRPDQVVVDSVSGSSGTTQYLSVLETDRSIEDYYTDIQWPDELPNSNIVEISSTLDTSDTVLMVRYSDNTVAAFNYVTGKLLFHDESEKTELEFGEYVKGWLTDTWHGLTGGVNDDYIRVEEAWQQAGSENAPGFIHAGGQAVQNGTNTGGDLFLTEEGENLEAGGAYGGDGETGENGDAGGTDEGSMLTVSDGQLIQTGGTSAQAAAEGLLSQEDPVSENSTAETGGLYGSETLSEGEPAENGEVVEGAQGLAEIGDDDTPEQPETVETGNETADAGAALSTEGTEADASGPGEAAGEDAETAAGETAADNPEEAAGEAASEDTGEAFGGTAAEDAETASVETAGEDAETASVETAAEDAETASVETAAEDMETAAGDVEVMETGTEDMEEDTAEEETLSGDGTRNQTSTDGTQNVASGALLTVYDPVTETYQVYRAGEYLSSGGQERRNQEGRVTAVSQTNVETVAGTADISLQDQMGGWAVALAALVGSGLLFAILYFGNRKKDS